MIASATVTNRIAGQGLRCWRRRKTCAGWKKMSIRSSQKVGGLAGAAEAAEDSVMKVDTGDEKSQTPWPELSLSCLSAAAPSMPPSPMDSTAELGTSIN